MANRKKTGVKKRYVAKRVKAGPRRQNRVFTDTGQELTVKKVVGGKKPRKDLSAAWKLLKSSYQKNIYAISYVNRYMSSAAGINPGYIWAGTQWTGTSVGNGQMIMPLHLYTLTGAPNWNGNALQQCAPFNILRRASTSGSMYFDNPPNSYTPVDSVMSVSGTNANSFPQQCDLLDAVSVKMMLYGCLTRPTKYRISLVQILDETLHPDYINNLPTASTGAMPGAEAAAAIAFYDQLTREDTYSGATFHNGNAVKGKIRFLKSWTHVFQPKLSTEPASIVDGQAGTTVPIAHSRSFNIYERFNRVQRYDWEEPVQTAESTSNAIDTVPQSIGLNKTDVTWKARIYLMVRALAPVHCVGSWNPSISPSYDISIRTYHSSLG